MALVYGGQVQWTSTAFDFHPAHLAATSFTFAPLAFYAPGDFDYSLYNSFGTIHLKSVVTDQSQSITGGGLMNVAFGTGLTVDAFGHLTGGTVTVLSQFTSPVGTFIGSIIGVNIAASALNAVAATVSTADDYALIQQAFSGNDLVALSDLGDRFRSSTGIDLVFSNAGNDKVWLGAGNDACIAGTGQDFVSGDGNDDLLVGNQGNDTLLGGAGRDLIDGGRGNDLLTGGAGVDTFVFVPGDGSDTVTDYQHGVDIINIGAGPASFAGLSLLQVGADAEVRFGNVVFTLTNTQAIDLAPADFTFIANMSVNLLASFANVFDFKG